MILSIIIIMFLSFGVVMGVKRGFTYQLIKMLSTIIVLLGALLLKNFLANIILNYFDFLDMDRSISILFYRGISFIILCFIFKIIIRLILKVSKNFEKILNATIILGIPSKILGGILGFVEYYIYTFIILLILSVPIFKIDVASSKIACIILNKTPSFNVKIDVSLFEKLKEEYDKGDQAKEEEYINILNEYGIIDKKDNY